MGKEVQKISGTRFQDENIVTVELYADGEVVERIIRG